MTNETNPGTVEDQHARRTALIERISTFADMLTLAPLEGEKGDVAYDLLRQSAAQIASDRLRLAAQSQPAALARKLGVRLAIVGRKKREDGSTENIRAFIDDIPLDQPTLNPIAPACDFLCHIAEQDIAATPATTTTERGRG